MKKNVNSLISLVIRFGCFFSIAGSCLAGEKSDIANVRPNILVLMSDNHLFSHLGCYGDQVVQTPNIDRVAKEGILFTHAFCQSPSCTPARAAMLTGRDVWQLREGANLWGTLPTDLVVYPDLLEKAGYLVGIEGKGWGPGNYEAGGWKRNPGGNRYHSFEEFYNEAERGQPWCYWFSSRDPHRPFRKDGGKKANIDLSKIYVPAYLPDVQEVREDIADYYSEIEQFDADVGHYLSLIGEMGQLENTVVVICSDNGWQMPRGLANLYDFGSRIPLIISWPGNFTGGREVDDFVLMNDFAPTFLELAGVPVPEIMTAKSLVNILKSDKSGQVETDRDYVVTARERHAFVRKNGAGYPGRAIRTGDYLYIRNYEPTRWPAGDPPLFGDVDAHMLQYPCPTKIYMLVNRDKKEVAPLFELAFGIRPGVELYDLAKDPELMVNVADHPEYLEIKAKLSNQLKVHLAKTGDPREGGEIFDFDKAEYYMDADKMPRPGEEAIKKLDLKKEYNYLTEITDGIVYDPEDDTWRKSADERIEQYRKADMTVTVVDTQGTPIPDANVSVKMTRHAFGFGTLISQARWENIPGAEVARQQKELAEQYFNKVVTIPTIKQSGDQMLDWLNERDIEVRGHYLMWARIQPGKRRGQPEAMPEDTLELRRIAFQYMEEMLTWAGDRISEWDVINHITTSGHLGFDHLFGFEIFADVIKYAKELAPWAEMGINEGGILWGNGPSMEAYYEVIQKLIVLDAKPDAVGFMSHFRENELITMEEIYKRLDRFAELVPHLQLTELDIDVQDHQLQANYLRDVMTIAFSHPAIFGIVMWNVWGDNNKALWNRDGTLRPAGEAWLDLVFNQWWTDQAGQTNSEGKFELRGFLGNYEITVHTGNETRTLQCRLEPEGNVVHFTF